MNKKIIAAALMQVAVLAASFTPSFAHGGFSINIGGGSFGYGNGYHHHHFYSPYNYYQPVYPVYPINTYNTYSSYGTLPVTNPIFVNQSTVPVVVPQSIPQIQVHTYNW